MIPAPASPAAAAVLSLVLASLAGARPVGLQVEPAPSAQLDEAARRDLQYDAANLRSASADPEIRAVAAQRLIATGHPEGLAILADALRSGDASTIEAVVTAMNLLEQPVADLLQPAVEGLRNAPNGAVDRLAFALTRFGDAALRPVIDLAVNREVPGPQRLGAIRTLAIFPFPESGAALMTIINPARGEESAVRAAAFASLRRLVPSDYGTDYRKWAEWWSGAQRKSRGEWAGELILRGFERTSELERARDDLVRRYVALLRDLYLDRPLERQFERLPKDLDDPLPAVRLFALGRLAVLLRDSVVIPDAIRERVVACIDSTDPEVRRQAASLLGEMDHPGFAQLLVARLPKEPDPAVAASWLDVLALHASTETIGAALPWLDRPETADAAARALWGVLSTANPDAAARQAIHGRAAPAWATSRTPAIARLLAASAPAEALSTYDELLRGENHDIAAAVAEAFLLRHRDEALLAAATVDAVRPFALRALAEGPATLDRFVALLAVPAPEAELARWEDAARQLGRRLSASDLIAADETLAASGATTAALRETLLLAAVLDETRAADAAAQSQLLLRLVPLLIERGAAMRAWELLETSAAAVNGNPALQRLRFICAIRVARYADAARVSEDPDWWIDALDQALVHDAEGAARLREEILTRFADRLSAEQRRRIDGAA